LSNFHSFAFDLAESPSNSLLFSQFVQVVWVCVPFSQSMNCCNAEG
jgi:hypothetical protein